MGVARPVIGTSLAKNLRLVALAPCVMPCASAVERDVLRVCNRGLEIATIRASLGCVNPPPVPSRCMAPAPSTSRQSRRLFMAREWQTHGPSAGLGHRSAIRFGLRLVLNAMVSSVQRGCGQRRSVLQAYPSHAFQ